MVIHVVRKGDTLFSIGREYGIDHVKIARDNEMPLDIHLIMGQTVVVDTGHAVKRGMIEVNGYAFPSISDLVLEKSLPFLSYLSIFGSQLRENGELSLVDDQKLIHACSGHQVLPIMVISNMQKEGYSSQILKNLIRSKALQVCLIDQILQVLEEKRYTGIDVDFANIPADIQDEYHEFLAKLVDNLHNQGYCIGASLLPRKSHLPEEQVADSQDYAYYGTVVDYVTIMNYESGGFGKGSQFIMPMNEIQSIMSHSVQEIDPEMTFIGIPNYGIDISMAGEEKIVASTLCNMQAVNLAKQQRAKIEYCTTAQAPFYHYFDENKVPHKVWFEDARSVRAKLNLPFQHNLAGVSIWTINRYNPQNWLILRGLYDIAKL